MSYTYITGQLGLMSLYETMFSQFDITTSQLLVTSFDFTSPERRRNIRYVISQLLALGKRVYIRLCFYLSVYI